jgi:hypothetical protein
MHPHHVDLHGLSLAEAEAKVRAMIDAAQQEDLELYELALRNIRADPADFAAVARLRAEHVRLREKGSPTCAPWWGVAGSPCSNGHQGNF